jgi:competence ComEA-like helix-hairpin-helix protein
MFRFAARNCCRYKRYLSTAAAVTAVCMLLLAGCTAVPRSYDADAGSNGSVSEHTVNINSAGVPELTRLPGIGEAVAKRIVEHREANGAFRRAEDLMLVQGISEEKFLAVRHLIRTK